MSYTNGLVNNGLANAQQVFNTADTAATARTDAASKANSVAANATTQNVAGPGVTSDQASLSSAGGAISQALSGSDVRADKVAGLQQSIAAGTYNVPASDVADKLMNVLLK